MSASVGSEATRANKHAFLVRVAELLHQHGTPSYRLERVMQKVGLSLDVDTTVLYTPTSLVMSLRDEEGEVTMLRRVTSGDVDVSKLLEFDAILDRTSREDSDLSEALAELEATAAAKPAFSGWLTTAASATACGSVAVLFGGGPVEILAALALGLVIAGIAALSGPVVGEAGLLEPVSGAIVAALALLTAQYLSPMDDRLVTLAALILPVPGLALTIALLELALGHLSSGSARLAGASVRLLTIVMGVALAWSILPDGIHPTNQFPYAVQIKPASWWMWPALVVAPAAFGILFRVPFSQWPYVFLVSAGGFLVSRYTDQMFSASAGSFCGALFVGCGSNVYARLKNRPAMAMQTPGVLILVPGSLGYRSLTAMVESETIRGVELAFAMILAGGCVVGGLLVANLLIPPKRIL